MVQFLRIQCFKCAIPHVKQQQEFALKIPEYPTGGINGDFFLGLPNDLTGQFVVFCYCIKNLFKDVLYSALSPQREDQKQPGNRALQN